MIKRSLLNDFACHVIDDNPALRAGFITFVAVDGQYDLEIEDTPDNVVAIYRTGQGDLDKAGRIADKLAGAFGACGMLIYASRDAWEEHLNMMRDSST